MEIAVNNFNDHVETIADSYDARQSPYIKKLG